MRLVLTIWYFGTITTKNIFFREYRWCSEMEIWTFSNVRIVIAEYETKKYLVCKMEILRLPTDMETLTRCNYKWCRSELNVSAEIYIRYWPQNQQIYPLNPRCINNDDNQIAQKYYCIGTRVLLSNFQTAFLYTIFNRYWYQKTYLQIL